MGRTGLTGWRAEIARLLTVALLLGSLLVPPFAEGTSGAPLGSATVSAAAGLDGAPGTPSRPHGILHAGSHCACQTADRVVPPQPVLPISFIAVGRQIFPDHIHASLEAEPPARPPRA